MVKLPSEVWVSKREDAGAAASLFGLGGGFGFRRAARAASQFPDRVAVQLEPVCGVDQAIPLSVLADWNESQAMADGWDVWFGIQTQWVPYAAIGTPDEVEYIAATRNTMSRVRRNARRRGCSG